MIKHKDIKTMIQATERKTRKEGVITKKPPFNIHKLSLATRKDERKDKPVTMSRKPTTTKKTKKCLIEAKLLPNFKFATFNVTVATHKCKTSSTPKHRWINQF